ncbi:MAG: hypothetical protein AAFX06_10920 [Planctomycetota bacterium]
MAYRRAAGFLGFTVIAVCVGVAIGSTPVEHLDRAESLDARLRAIGVMPSEAVCSACADEIANEQAAADEVSAALVAFYAAQQARMDCELENGGGGGLNSGESILVTTDADLSE